MSEIYAERYHDISCGHRVYGHENKCANLHGHNYRIHFKVRGTLDKVGRVLDFAVIKSMLCDWLELHWDHRFLVWDGDPVAAVLQDMDRTVVVLPFNPTAENMGLYLLNTAGPELLNGTNVELVSVQVEETRKCSAVVTE